MSTNSFLQHLPDYLQLDLNGLVKSFAEAVDECLVKFDDDMTKDVAMVSLIGTHSGRLREDLTKLGFQSQALKDFDLISFSKIRHQLVADSGSLTGVRRLADIYFPGASVQRGRPYPRQKLESTRHMRLSDRGERRQVVSVLLPQVAELERVSEFIANCRMLIPATSRVEVRVANAEFKAASAGFRLGQGVIGERVTGGRLGCRISLS